MPRRFTLFIQHRLIKDSWADELDILHASSSGMTLAPDKDILKSMDARALVTTIAARHP